VRQQAQRAVNASFGDKPTPLTRRFAPRLTLFVIRFAHRSTGDDRIVFIAHNLTSTSEFTADNAQAWLMGGMFAAGIFATVTTFFFAFWLRKLPGFKKIL